MKLAFSLWRQKRSNSIHYFLVVFVFFAMAGLLAQEFVFLFSSFRNTFAFKNGLRAYSGAVERIVNEESCPISAIKQLDQSFKLSVTVSDPLSNQSFQQDLILDLVSVSETTRNTILFLGDLKMPSGPEGDSKILGKLELSLAKSIQATLDKEAFAFEIVSCRFIPTVYDYISWFIRVYF